MAGPQVRKIDLHVHSFFSNFRHLKALRARDSCNDSMRDHQRCREIDEANHEDLGRARGSVYEFVQYLRSRNLVHFLNHPLQGYRMQKKPMRFVEDLLELFTHGEVGNGTLPPDQNRAAAGILEYARRMGLTRVGIGTSDAHGLRPIGAFLTLASGEDKTTWLAPVAEENSFVARRAIGLRT